jgi:hypothetical protein
LTHKKEHYKKSFDLGFLFFGKQLRVLNYLTTLTNEKTNKDREPYKPSAFQPYSIYIHLLVEH